MTTQAAQPPRVVLRRETRFIRMVFLLLLLAVLAGAVMYLLGTFGRRRPFYAPQPLRSGLFADYGADPFADKAAGFGPGLVEDIIRDDADTGAPDRIATVVSNLQTPVPGVIDPATPEPTSTPVSSATLAVGASRTPTRATSTATVEQTATVPGQPTATSTGTRFAPPSSTGPVLASATPTGTSAAPPTPTRTNTPISTQTLASPTWTLPPPTHTLPPPTNTLPPPTNTPVPPTITPSPTSPPTPTDTPVPPPTTPPPTVYP